MRLSGVTYVPRKTRTWRRTITLVSVFILLAIIASAIISIYVGWNLTHPKRLALPTFSSNIVPEYKDVTFQDAQKSIKLNGWLFESKGSNKTVIISHGYSKNRLQFGEQTLDMVKSFLEKNYNVFIFDYRNSGISGGNLTSLGINEKDDLIGAVKYIKSLGTKNITLLGFSAGAATSIVAAAESKDVDAVIADSPFSDLKEYLDANLSVWSHLPAQPFNKTILTSMKALLGLDPQKMSPRKSIVQIAPRPILLIHSRDDKKIPVSNSRELYEAYSKAASSNAYIWEPDGTVHVGAYPKDPKEYMSRVFVFLDKINNK